MASIHVEDDGYIEVTLKRQKDIGGDGPAEVTRTLDLYRIHNELVDIYARTRGKPTHEQHQAIGELLAGYGFPEVSHRAADRFASEIHKEVASRKKRDGGE